MSQSRFSIVLVGVSALLRRPFVSRLRPAGFTARGSGGFRRSGRPSVSEIAAGRVGSSAFRFGVSLGELAFGLTAPLFGTRRFGVAARWVGLRAHGFRFSARTASGLPSASWSFRLPFRRLPLGELAFGLTASAFRHAPLRSCRWASWPSGSRLPLFGMRRFGVAARRVGLRAHGFRFSARTASELPLGELVLPPSVSEIAARRVGLRAHDFRFRHAPLRGCPRRVGSSAFRFGDCHSAGWPSGSRLPLFGTHRFGVAARRVGSAAFRFGVAARRVGLRAHGFRFSACADPHRRTADARIDGAHRHDTCFTSKHLSQHVNLPHRSPQALQNRQTPLLSPTRHPRG